MGQEVRIDSSRQFGNVVNQQTLEQVQRGALPIEQYYSVAEVSAKMSISDTKVRRMFQNESGVLKIGEPSRRVAGKLKRRYYTLRIPESAIRHVIARLAQRKTIH
jgi:hypothetical protein